MTFRDFPEYYFNNLSENKGKEIDFINAFINDLSMSDKSILLLVDVNVLKEDKLMANAIKNLQPHLLPEHQKRIALVFSMFETAKLQEDRKDIEKFAEIFLPQTVNALDDLIEYNNCDVADFACSAFGFIEESGKLIPDD